MLVPRILTALVLLALIVPALMYLAPAQLVLAIGGVMLVAAWEWGGFFPNATWKTRVFFTVFVALVLVALHQVPSLHLGFPVILWVAVVWWIVALIWILTKPDVVPSLAIFLAGLTVCVSAWVALSVLQLKTSLGPQWLLFLIVLIASADVGAYVAGRLFGRHKLAPRVSPGKTWEGVAGGVILSGLVAIAGNKWFAVQHWGFVMLCVSVAWVSVVGDLAESLFKRNAGLKDSGRILPGHGGVMDRIDSLTAAAPIFVLGLAGLGLLGT